MVNKEKDSLQELIGGIPADVQIRTKLSVAIANRIETLMREAGYTKKQFAEALGCRPSEVTKWLSGEHNFTIATLSRIGSFFGAPIISVSGNQPEA